MSTVCRPTHTMVGQSICFNFCIIVGNGWKTERNNLFSPYVISKICVLSASFSQNVCCENGLLTIVLLSMTFDLLKHIQIHTNALSLQFVFQAEQFICLLCFRRHCLELWLFLLSSAVRNSTTFISRACIDHLFLYRDVILLKQSILQSVHFILL